MKLPQGSDYHGNGEHYSKKEKKCCPCGDLDCPGVYVPATYGFTGECNTYRNWAQDHFEAEVRKLVENLPNNMELGEKIRELCS
tara:strand:+ start:1601 stop:1852 length:252 start_codon:yes stop_codon:yes gene_type:complete